MSNPPTTSQPLTYRIGIGEFPIQPRSASPYAASNTRHITPRSSAYASPEMGSRRDLCMPNPLHGPTSSTVTTASRHLLPYGKNYTYVGVPSPMPEHGSEETTPSFDTSDQIPDMDQFLFGGSGSTTEPSSTSEVNFILSPHEGAIENQIGTNRGNWPMSPGATHSSEATPAEFGRVSLDGESGGHSGEGSVISSGVVNPHVNKPVERDEEGRWTGLPPEMRDGIVSSATATNGYLEKNIKEEEADRKTQQKNSEVEQWVKAVPSKIARLGGNLAPPVNQANRRHRSLSDVSESVAAANRLNVASIYYSDTMMDTEDDDVDDGVKSMHTLTRSDSLDEREDDSPLSLPVHPETMVVDREQEEYDPAKDPNNEPRPEQFYSAKARGDNPTNITRLPPTASAAMWKYEKVIETFETASRVATWGTGAGSIRGRRKSWDSLAGLRDPPAAPSPPTGKKARKPSIFQMPVMVKEKLKRSSTLTSTRGGETTSTSPRRGTESFTSGHTRKGSLEKPTLHQSGSWFTTKNNLKLDTISALGVMASSLSAVGGGVTVGQGSPVGAPKSPRARSPSFFAEFANNITAPVANMKRTRSKSDLTGGIRRLIKPQPGAKEPQSMIELLKSMGGLPGPMAAKPRTLETSAPPGNEEVVDMKDKEATKTKKKEIADSDDSDSEDGVEMVDQLASKQEQKRVIIPTYQGFVENVREMFPELAPKLVNRIALEQVKRYKRLTEHKTKHNQAISQGKCPHGKNCSAVAETIPQVTVQKGDGSSTINLTFANEPKPAHFSEDGTITSFQFPSGVPFPPASKLPADFECPICFKFKKFHKPSDWTKHVHEDVQPFTCTWPECTEPKSFKRKADWVRHENEKHRYLEWWECNLEDCTHKCFRKDNFVQHLVRQHKKPDPKIKTQKATAKSASDDTAPTSPLLMGNGNKGKGLKRKDDTAEENGDATAEEIEEVREIVDNCHKEDNKSPTDEKCKFCGATCGSWKKLAVHLARHMEAISLPILDLVKDDVKSPTAGAHLSAQKPASRRTFSPAITAMTPVSPMTPESPKFITPLRDASMDKTGTNTTSSSFVGGYDLPTLQCNSNMRPLTPDFTQINSPIHRPPTIDPLGIVTDTSGLSASNFHPGPVASYKVNGMPRPHTPNPPGSNCGRSNSRLGVPVRWQSNSPTPMLSPNNLSVGQLPQRPHSSHGPGRVGVFMSHQSFAQAHQLPKQNNQYLGGSPTEFTTTSGSTTLMAVDQTRVYFSGNCSYPNNRGNNGIRAAPQGVQNICGSTSGATIAFDQSQIESIHTNELSQSLAAIEGMGSIGNRVEMSSIDGVGSSASINVAYEPPVPMMHPGIRIDMDGGNASISSENMSLDGLGDETVAEWWEF